MALVNICMRFCWVCTWKKNGYILGEPYVDLRQILPVIQIQLYQLPLLPAYENSVISCLFFFKFLSGYLWYIRKETVSVPSPLFSWIVKPSPKFQKGTTLTVCTVHTWFYFPTNSTILHDDGGDDAIKVPPTLTGTWAAWNIPLFCFHPILFSPRSLPVL